MSDWASHYFEHGYAQRWGVLPVTDRIRHDAACLWRRLQLAPKARVVDLGCGQGRYALGFAEHGADVIGVDAAASLLRQAKRLAAGGGSPAHWVQGDIRSVALRRSSCDAVVVIDAFGFFEAEDDNERVLAEAARVLVPGGSLAVKVVNGAPILASFRHADREERDGVVVTLSRSLTLDPPRMIERVSVSGSRGSGQYERRPAALSGRGVVGGGDAGRLHDRRRVRRRVWRRLRISNFSNHVVYWPAAARRLTTACSRRRLARS